LEGVPPYRKGKATGVWDGDGVEVEGSDKESSFMNQLQKQERLEDDDMQAYSSVRSRRCSKAGEILSCYHICIFIESKLYRMAASIGHAQRKAMYRYRVQGRAGRQLLGKYTTER
jgi:hypothetical protein